MLVLPTKVNIQTISDIDENIDESPSTYIGAKCLMSSEELENAISE